MFIMFKCLALFSVRLQWNDKIKEGNLGKKDIENRPRPPKKNA